MKQCSKVSLIGESCNTTADCYPAGVSCVNGVCAQANIVRKRGEICANDNGTNRLACEAGSICANCTDSAGGYRCIAEVNGCCSFGSDRLNECPDSQGQCCNFACTNTTIDRNNCGVCGNSCQSVPSYLSGGDQCWNSPGRCNDAQCQFDSKCGAGQVCGVPPVSIGQSPTAVCYTPLTLPGSLFEYASLLGSFDFLTLQGNTAVACASDADCIAGYCCSNNCNELIFFQGSHPGTFGSGVSAACIDPGVCLKSK